MQRESIYRPFGFNLCRFLLVLMLFSPIPAFAKDFTEPTITIYVDAPFGHRKKGSATALTESHKKYRAAGYRLLDLDIYTENGDLKGFFVTYVRE